MLLLPIILLASLPLDAPMMDEIADANAAVKLGSEAMAALTVSTIVAEGRSLCPS